MSVAIMPILRNLMNVFWISPGTHWGFNETIEYNGTAHKGWFTFTVTEQCRPGEH